MELYHKKVHRLERKSISEPGCWPKKKEFFRGTYIMNNYGRQHIDLTLKTIHWISSNQANPRVSCLRI